LDFHFFLKRQKLIYKNKLIIASLQFDFFLGHSLPFRFLDFIGQFDGLVVCLNEVNLRNYKQLKLKLNLEKVSKNL